MPTESTFLLAGLLFLAAALGYFFAVYGDDREDQPAEPVSPDYLRGVNFLINEQPDRALEIFMRMAEVDDGTLETHFAMGSLFRRQGEMDRAIRVHKNLIGRDNLSPDQRDQARFELAEDYLSAGLFDRAEELFKELKESPSCRHEALRKLVRLYEVTHDWEEAIAVYTELETDLPDTRSTNQVAHYFCELAQQELAGGDVKAASAYLDKAEEGRTVTSRGRMLRARAAALSGDVDGALSGYGVVLENDPLMTSEVIPEVLRLLREQGENGATDRFLQELVARQPDSRTGIAMATVLDGDIVAETALQTLRDIMEADDVLAALVNLENEQALDLDRIRNGLRRIVTGAPRYRCIQCGYRTLELVWQCPSCKTWETSKPLSHLRFMTADR